jgi:hypothetical protein
LPAEDVVDTAGGRGRSIAEGRGVGTATNLHDELAIREAQGSTMTWRKKLYDDLAVRK